MNEISYQDILCSNVLKRDVFLICFEINNKNVVNACKAIIPKIIYGKLVFLSRNGLKNISTLCAIFNKNINNNTSCKLLVYLFECKDKKNLDNLIEKLSAVSGVNENSIFTLNREKLSIGVLDLFFNKNTNHFLNYAKVQDSYLFDSKINQFKDFIQKNEISPNDIALDSGMVLEAYGIRVGGDVDYFINDNQKIKFIDDRFDNHDSQLRYHGVRKTDLIYNSNFYFYYKGLKFLSFNQVHHMKKSRQDFKDILDVNMMDAIEENNKLKFFFNLLKYKIFSFSLHLLKIFRIYRFVKFIFRNLFNGKIKN